MTLMSKIGRAFTRRGGGAAQPGADLHRDLKISLEEAFAGTLVPIPVAAPTICESCAGTGGGERPCPACGGQGRVHKEQTLKVHIPPGIEDGTRIRLGGAGAAGVRGAPPGDLYIFVAIA